MANQLRRLRCGGMCAMPGFTVLLLVLTQVQQGGECRTQKLQHIAIARHNALLGVGKCRGFLGLGPTIICTAHSAIYAGASTRSLAAFDGPGPIADSAMWSRRLLQGRPPCPPPCHAFDPAC